MYLGAPHNRRVRNNLEVFTKCSVCSIEYSPVLVWVVKHDVQWCWECWAREQNRKSLRSTDGVGEFMDE